MKSRARIGEKPSHAQCLTPNNEQMNEQERLSPDDWQDLIERVRMNSKDKGFHEGELSLEHKLMLIICEVSEAVEADREGRLAQPMPEDWQTLNDEDFKMTFLRNVKDSLEDELADAVIRMMDSGYLDDTEEIVLPNTFTRVTLFPPEGKGLAFVEQAYYLVVSINAGGLIGDLTRACQIVFYIAKHRNIDIVKHIRMKMRYNSMRPRLHGKAY